MSIKDSLILSKLDGDKIKINWNKNPIDMELFLSFLTVDVDRSRDHLGSENGWTRLVNKEVNLVIGGGIVGGNELLDSIQYGTNLANPYNNYVNPFYLHDIMSIEGQIFFYTYYKTDIDKIISDQKIKIESLQKSYVYNKDVLGKMLEEEKLLISAVGQ